MKRLIPALGGVLVFGLFQATVASFGQAKKDGTYSGLWTSTKTSPLGLAESVDKRLAQVNQLMGAYKVVMEMNGHGQSIGDLHVQNGSKFLIEYPNMHYRQSDRDVPIDKVSVTSDGKAVVVKSGASPMVRVPAANYRLYTAKSVEDWVFGFPKYIESSIRGEHALTNLIQQASKPGSGYDVKVQQRDVVSRGRNFPQMRLVVDRKPEVARRSGPVQIAIIVDSNNGLPVSGVTAKAPPTKAPVSITCSLGWQSSLLPFPASMFDVGK